MAQILRQRLYMSGPRPLKPPNHAFDRTPESIAALRRRPLGGAGQGKRFERENVLVEMVSVTAHDYRKKLI